MSFTFGSSNHGYDEGGLRLEDANDQSVRMDNGRSSSYTFGSDEFVELHNTNQVDAQRMTQSLNHGQTTLSTNCNKGDDAQRFTQSLNDGQTTLSTK